ncbi:MAG TPA: T9SS type A sorting domain-containing protein [Bacteroidia bacterium]|nr:T9SS type A sorting domain-containing protein [Bacteroidia bacterium]
MKKIYAALFALFMGISLFSQTLCDQNGNVVIYSNYDGGPLTINVDQNIPNLKIGVLSYEFCRITITGTYAANVTALWYVGYNGNNDHCSLGAPLYTTISGVPNPVDSILLMPAATFSNPNGYGQMICNYTCTTTTNQGGCNTADQTAHYFLTKFGGTLRQHTTQYGCWTGAIDISAGGNCCANPLTGIAATETHDLFTLSPNPGNGVFMLTLPSSGEVRNVEVLNLLGEIVRTVTIQPGTTAQEISLVDLGAGTYFVRMQSGEMMTTEKVVVTD